MTTATIKVLTADEVAARRQELLDSVGGDEAALRERAEDYGLSAAELAALSEIDGLDFIANGR